MLTLREVLKLLPSADQKKIYPQIMDVARDLIAISKKDRTTKDGYGAVLQVLGGQPKTTQGLILAGMYELGYPESTIYSLKNIL